MLQIDHPFPTIFRQPFIHLECLRVLTQSYICSQNKQFIAIFTSIERRQEIVVYKYMQGMWTEYFKFNVQKQKDTNLLCFVNDDNQILISKPITNTIQVLKLEQSLHNGQQQVTGVMNYFYKFQDQEEKATMISSSDGKFVLIQKKFSFLLFDVNQIVIVAQFVRTCQQLRNFSNYMNFFNDQFIMQIHVQSLKGIQQLLFYNINNQKMKKLICVKRISFEHNYIINKNQYLVSSFYHQIDNIVGLMMNIANLKLIRKIKIGDNQKFNQFLGVVDQYYLIKSIDTFRQISYLKIDLFNLQKEEFQFNYDCQYKNEILKISSQNDGDYSYFCLKI